MIVLVRIVSVTVMSVHIVFESSPSKESVVGLIASMTHPVHSVGAGVETLEDAAVVEFVGERLAKLDVVEMCAVLLVVDEADEELDDDLEIVEADELETAEDAELMAEDACEDDVDVVSDWLSDIKYVELDGCCDERLDKLDDEFTMFVSFVNRLHDCETYILYIVRLGAPCMIFEGLSKNLRRILKCGVAYENAAQRAGPQKVVLRILSVLSVHERVLFQTTNRRNVD